MNAAQAREALARALEVAGRRWRRRVLLHGAAKVLGIGVLIAIGAIAAMDVMRFAPEPVAIARIGVYAVLLLLVLRYLVLARPRWRDAGVLARHLEARDPSLQALLLTAVEESVRKRDSALSARLYRDAAAICRDPEGPGAGDRRGARRAAGYLVVLTGVLLLAVLSAPPAWRHGALLLAAPWWDARAGMPYAIDAAPGSVSIVEGADLALSGVPRGFRPQAMTLVYRAPGEDGWRRIAMVPGAAADAAAAAGADVTAAETAAFGALLPEVSAPLEYYMEGETVTSARHRVEVQWLPRARRLDHHYRYPRYTGLAGRTVENATAVAAVSGTEVQVRVLPEATPQDMQPPGELVLDGETRRALEWRDGNLVASFAVDEAQHYRIELTAADGSRVAVTPEHPVTALADGAPRVRVVSPTGEARVTSVEEVQVSIEAADDVVLRTLELVLSVNGGPEQVLALDTGEAAAVQQVFHTMLLEERGLAPGDLIAFHARASDGVEARSAVSDIHFMEVRPFDRDYSRQRSSGSRQGGGGQQQQNLTAQQRDLLVALFRLARDRQRLPEAERVDRLTTLAAAQGRIRERVEAIVRRLRGRALVQTTPGYKVMLEAMPRAAAAMRRVEALLAVPDPDSALPPAREALTHLQRADAAFREVQLASQREGGGQGRADNRDLSRLFELEIDRLRTRYSQVQRAAAPAREQQVDEALRRLEELARRQRQEVERAARRAARGETGGGAAPSQQRLAQAMDDLQRQLERLSRERPGGSLDAAREALEQAAAAMREVATGAGGESAAREALERLGEAREALAGDAAARQAEGLERARQTAQSLAERHRRVQQQLESAGADGQSPPATGPAGDSPLPAPGASAGKEVDAIKRAMEDDATALREALDRLGGGSERDSEAGRGARQAAGVMREEDVEGRLRRSREELLSGAPDRGLEESIGRALERVREQVAGAAEAAQRDAQGARSGTGAGTQPPTREQIRAVLGDLDALRERVREGGRGRGGGSYGNDASRLRSLAGRLDGLRGPVADNPAAAGDLETLIAGIEGLARGEAAAQPALLLDALSTVERALAGGGDAPTGASARDPGRTPAGFGALVDDYFRRLGEAQERVIGTR